MEFRTNTTDGNIREEYSRIIDHYINLLTTVNTLQSQLTTTQTQINRRIQNITNTLRWLPNNTQNRTSGFNGLFNTPSNNPRNIETNRSSRRQRSRNNSRSRDSSTRNSNTQTTNSTTRRDINTLHPISENTSSENNSNITNNLFRNMMVEIQSINGEQYNQQNPVNDLLTAMLSNDTTRNDASMNDIFNTSTTEHNIPSPFPQFTPFQNTRQQTPRQSIANNTTPQLRNNGVSTNIFTTAQPFTTTFMTPTFGGSVFGGGTSLFENVPVFPSAEQIDNATRTIAFQEIESPINTSCPITMENFEPSQLVMQITHCGHIFNPTHLHSWFRTHVKCPVCRHDIRESRENQQPSLNDTSNNTVTGDIFSSRPLVDIEQPLSSLGTINTLSGQTSNNQHTPYRPRRLSLLSLANAASQAPPILNSQLSPISSNNDIANTAVSNSTNSLGEDTSGNEIQLPTYTFNPPITTFNSTTAQNGVSVVSQGRIIHTDNRLGELTALSSLTESILRSMITEIDISGNPIQHQINTDTTVNNSNEAIDVSNNSQQTNTTDVSGGLYVNGNILPQDILDSLGYISQD